METIIKQLRNNPIFSMSLGSKELFHSNFLEYLWHVNRDSFINVVNEFLPHPLEENQQYEIGREVENFDICIYHEENKKRVYDLVIENKVKSIPYKEQLMEYEKKANNSPCCKFILLTLSDDFPDKDNVERWKILRYDELRKSIEKYYISENTSKESHLRYIIDYCDFLEQLVSLKELIIPKDFANEESKLFEAESIKCLKSVRLHDLYIKLRCSMFALILKNKLKENGVSAVVIDKYSNRKRKENGERVVNLNIAINQGEGQIAAWICDGEDTIEEKSDTFEIVIQGNQYRHGINQMSIQPDDNVKGEEKFRRLNVCYERLETNVDKRAMQFINFNDNDEANVFPLTGKKYHFKNTKTMKSGPFCCYGHAYIYRYKSISGIKVKDLIEIMLSDIIDIYSNLPRISKN